jgi:hypothetical protein
MIVPRRPTASSPGPRGPDEFSPTGGSCRRAALAAEDIRPSCQQISSLTACLAARAAAVPRSFRLEQSQCPLRAVRRPHRDDPPVSFAQCLRRTHTQILPRVFGARALHAADRQLDASSASRSGPSKSRAVADGDRRPHAPGSGPSRTRPIANGVAGESVRTELTATGDAAVARCFAP